MLIPLRSLWEPGTSSVAVTPGAYMAHPGILAMPQFLIERRKERQLEEELLAILEMVD